MAADKTHFIIINKFIAFFTALIFLFGSVCPAYAQRVPGLLAPGSRMVVSPRLEPLILMGLEINPEDPFFLNFMIDTGEQQISPEVLREESLRLIKYFLAGLTIPEEDLWVNLSPFEKERIMPLVFGTTELGRDMLAQDYLLKQLASSLSYPEDQLGQEFWSRVYRNMVDKYGTADINADMFNKVWVMPEVADVYEDGSKALIVDSHLSVMLEEDYLASGRSKEAAAKGDISQASLTQRQVSELTLQAMRELVLPEIVKEVNEGARFVHLRQIYHSLILAVWFKRTLRKSVWEKSYIGKNRVVGVDVEDKDIKEKIYQQYLEALRQGVYNTIHEEEDALTHERVSRRYFSGGVDFGRQVGAHLRVSATVPLAAQGRMQDLVDRGRIAAVNSTVDPAEASSEQEKEFAQEPHSFVYSGAEYRDGQIAGGVLLNEQGCRKKLELNKVLREHPLFTGVIDRLLLDKRGGLIHFNGNDTYWKMMKGYENTYVRVVMKEGQVVGIYDDKQQLIYPFNKHLVYLGAVYEEGKIKGGRLLNPQGIKDPQTLTILLKKYPGFSGVVDRVQCDKAGTLMINNTFVWMTRSAYKNVFVKVVFQNGDITAVFSEEEEQLFPYVLNYIYEGATYKDGKVIGGHLVTAKGLINSHALNQWFKDHRSFSGVVHNNQLNAAGGLWSINDRFFWNSMRGYENARVDIVMSEGDVVEVFDSRGKKLYPYMEYFAFEGARYVDGKIVGGVLVNKEGAQSSAAFTAFMSAQFPKFSGVVDRVPLTGFGGLSGFAGNSYWIKMVGYENALVVVEMKDGVVTAVHDEFGRQIYSPDEKNHNLIYRDAEYKNGAIQGGSLVIAEGFRDRLSLNLWFKKDPVFTGVIDRVKLGNKGQLTNFNGRDYWQSKVGYENELITVVIKEGQVLAVYNKAAEQIYSALNDNNLIYVGAGYVDGRIEGGQLLSQEGVRGRVQLNHYLEKNPEFSGVIKNVPLSNNGAFSGFFGKTYWVKKSGYEKALVTVVMRRGEVIYVYDLEGQLLYSVFPDDIMITSGSGEKIGFRNKEELNGWLKDHPGFSGVIEQYQLKKDGSLKDLNGKDYWGSRISCGYAVVRIRMAAGEVLSVEGEDNEVLFPFNQNYVYLNAAYNKGEILGGELLNPQGAVDKLSLNKILEEYPNFSGVLDRVKLDKSGGLLNIKGVTYWRSAVAFKDSYVRIVMKNGEVEAVYSQQAQLLYPFQENFVYAQRVSSDGNVVKGDLLTKGGLIGRQALNQWLVDHPGFNGIVSRVRLDSRGGLKDFNGKNYWLTRKGFENALVDIVMKNGMVIDVYDDQENFLYSTVENLVYQGAHYEDGEIVGGELLNKEGFVNRAGLNDFLTGHSTFSGVIGKVRLDPHGALLSFNGRDWWTAANGYTFRDLITIVMQEGEVTAAYSESGELLYPFSRHLVYQGALYEDGKIIGGKLLNDREVPGRTGLARFMKTYKNFSGVIDKVLLGKNGGLRAFLRRYYWSSLEGYEEALVTVVMKDGEVESVYDEQARLLYPFRMNQIYLSGKFENGSFKGEGLLSAKRQTSRNVMNAILAQRTDFTGFIEDLVLSEGGMLGVVNGHTYREVIKGYANARVVAQLVNGKVVKVYAGEGKLIWSENRDHQVQQILNTFWETGEFQKLVELFGEESTNRILFAFLGNVTPQQVLRFSQQHRERAIAQDRVNVKPGKASLRSYLKKLSELTTFSRPGSVEFEHILKNEAFRSLYKYVVQDHSFLKIIEAEAGREGVNSILKNVFMNILDVFERVGNSQFQGLRESTKLKFYQKYGVKFILDQQRVLLADKPGLGKTVQALAAAVNAYEGRGAQKVLIVCPKVAMRDAWERQITRHLKGEQKIFMFKDRKKLRDKRQQKKFDEARFYIVNFEALQGERGQEIRERLKRQGIDFIIMDEAHRIRNDNQISESILEFDAPYKVLLTASAQKGRSIAKIFNLLNWLYPEKYADRETFLRQYNSDEGFRQLKMEMQEYTLRRHNEDVLMDMSNLSIEYRPVQLTGEQAHFYRIYEQNLAKVLRENEMPNFNSLIRLAVDMALIKRVIITNGRTGETQEILPGITPIYAGGREYRIFTDNGHDAIFIRSRDSADPEQYVVFEGKKGDVIINEEKFGIELRERESQSAKYEALDTIVNDVTEMKREHLVIFTGIVKVANDLKERYERKGINVLTITGATTQIQRDRILKEFQFSQEPTVLVCTYQTLGESVDLTRAHYGVLVDSPWQDRDQTIGRLYRIGQEQDVKFYILQAVNTIDDHIEQVNWEADMIRRIVLDDAGSMYKNQGELLQLYLSSHVNRQNERSLLERFRERIRVIAQQEGPEVVKAHLTEIRQGDNDVAFNGTLLTSHLGRKHEGRIKFAGMDGLLKGADLFDQESRAVVKAFILQRLNEENEGRVRTREKLLWYFLKEIVPGFEDIDYDGHLEFIVELGGFIIRKIIENSAITKEELMAEAGEVAERLFEETMYYLDRSNIFKLLSLIGVIPQTYYYEGKLMKYDSPIRIYYLNGSIRYYDEKIVEKIAPGWRVPDAKILDALTGFERDAARVRLLDEAEEKRLANQLRLGNKAAEDVLIGAHLRDVDRISRRAVQKVEAVFNRTMKGVVQKERLYEEGGEALTSLVRTFADHEIYDNTLLSQYLAERLGPRIYSRAYEIIKQVMELGMDEAVYNDSDVMLKDLQVEHATPESNLEDNETLFMFRNLLKGKGFSLVEVDLLVLFTFEGYTVNDLMEHVAQKNLRQKEELNSDYLKSLVSRFQKAMDDLGEAGFLSALHGEDEEEEGDYAMVSDDPGGIDMRPDVLLVTASGNAGVEGEVLWGLDGESFMLNEASFEGFRPIILNIVPVRDLSVLIRN